MKFLLKKSFIAEHQRKKKDGTLYTVAAHYDKRTKKASVHAPEHSHNVEKLSDEDKTKFSNMHKEQHVHQFFDAHGHKLQVEHHTKMAEHHNKQADKLASEGKHRLAAESRRQADKHTVKLRSHQLKLDKHAAIVEGIGKLKEGMVEGSGTLMDDADKAHKDYVGKFGDKFKVDDENKAKTIPLDTGASAPANVKYFESNMPADNKTTIDRGKHEGEKNNSALRVYADAYRKKSEEDKAVQKQTIQDMIETNRNENRNIQHLVDRLAVINQVDKNSDPDDNVIYSNQVSGHPENESHIITRNLIPFFVRNKEEAERKLDYATDLLSDYQGQLARANYSVSIAKTAAQKNKAIKELKGINNKGIDSDGIEALRDETIPELERIYKEAKKREVESQDDKLLATNEGVQGVSRPDKLDKKKIEAGYSHRSNSVGARVAMENDWHEKAVKEFADKLEPIAKSDEQKALAKELTQKFKEDYVENRHKVLSVGAGVVSRHIAGGSKFNSKQSSSRGDSLDRAEEAFTKWGNAQMADAEYKVLRARSPEQLAAEKKAVDDKNADKQSKDDALLLKLVNFKSGDNLTFGKGKVVRVSKGKDGIPSSMTMEFDGSIKGVNDKFELGKIFGGKEKLAEAFKRVAAAQ